MPGLIGYVGNKDKESTARLLKDMAQGLEPEKRFRVELYSEQGWGIGRVSLGVLNPGPQPVWNEDRSLCLVMEGEFFDQQSLHQALGGNGQPATPGKDAELALRLFEAYGEDFAGRLNGAFVIAIWDRSNQRMLVVNDRLGLHPLYYASTGSGFLFASGVRALMADPALPRNVNRLAIAQFLTFDHMLGDQTMLEDVRLLPGGSVLGYGRGRSAIRPYWTVRHPDTFELKNETEWLDGLVHYIRQAVQRQSGDDIPAGILLSGGLDSRFLLAALTEEPPATPLHSFTWGIPGCDDVRYAAELAKQTGARHHFFELKPDWLRDLAGEAVRISDGNANIVNMHALATLEDEAQYANVIYKGFMGDAMMGFALRYQFWANYDPETWREAHLQVHRDQGVINYDDEGHEALFSSSFRQRLNGGVWESYHAAMAQSESQQMALQRLQFDYQQRVPRMTINGVEAVRSRTAVRLPFCDNDLVDYTLTIPPGLLYDRRIIKDAFIRAYPELCKIPTTTTGLPLISCARDVRMRAGQWLNWQMTARGMGRLAPPLRRPYKDYNTWFRTALRDWIEDTLLNSRALDRGYFNPDYVRQLVAEHMAGTDHAVRLGALMSVELWHRQFID